MNLARRLAYLERTTRETRLVAELEAGRRRVQDLSDAELDLLAASIPPAERAWLEGLSNDDLRRVSAGELVYPERGVSQNVSK